MPVKLNRAALEHAEQLISDGSYRINTQWREAQPSDTAESRYIDQHGYFEYSLWYLGIDTDENDETKARYKFPVGDFKSVHRSGLIAAKQRAAQNAYDDIESAADDLLELFDRLNAC